jgi:hypothetical protein
MDDMMDEIIKGRRDIKWSFPLIRPVVHADGHPGSSKVAGYTPSLYWESNTAAFCPGGGGGRLEGRFFFKLYLVWRVDSRCPLGQSIVDFPCKFYLGAGGGFIFLSANGKAQSALLLFLLSLGGEKDFFSIFPCFPMCFHNVPSKFLMGSQYVPQVHDAFLYMFCI